MRHEEYLALRRFPALDGLRALAAVLVVLFHFGGPFWSGIGAWLAVDMFFVLSGYLITTLALREESRTGRRLDLRAFYLRRLFRITPVYFLVVAVTAVALVLRGQLRGSGFVDHIWYIVTFNAEYAPPPTDCFAHAWTLGVEQKFYLVWPLLAFTLPGRSLRRKALAAATGFGVFLVLVCAGEAVPCHPYVAILIGCTLAIAMHHPVGFAVLRRLAHPVPACLIAAGFALLQLHVMDLYAVLGADGTGVVLVYSAGAALLVAAVLGRNPVAAALAMPPLVYIGQRSYSLYLVQHLASFVVLGTVTWLPAGSLASGSLVALIALAMADVLYRWIERPAVAAGRAIIAAGRTKPTVAAAAPDRAETAAPDPG